MRSINSIRDLTPRQWALVFLLPYRREANRRGVKLARRHLERLKNGFCADYAFKRRGMDPINGFFWWTYADNMAALLSVGNRSLLRQAIMRPLLGEKELT